jgi:hypothetical protein
MATVVVLVVVGCFGVGSTDEPTKQLSEEKVEE